MTSAKVIFKVEDRSTNVVSIGGISVGMAVMAKKGIPFKPRLITTEAQLIEFAGDPHPTLGSTLYAAKRYLSQGNQLWLSRAVSKDATCSAALVRSKVNPLPRTPVEQLHADHLVVRGLTGMKYADIPAYQFPVYLGNRVYEDPKVKVTADSSYERVAVSSVLEFKVGDKVSVVTDPNLEELNSPDDTVGEQTDFATVVEVFDQDVTKEIITLNSPLTAAKGTEIQYLNTEEAPTSFSPKVIVQEDVISSLTVVVNDSDLVHDDVTLVVGLDEYTLVSKDLVEVPTKELVLDAPLPAAKDANVLIIATYEMEERDSFLVHTTPGAEGNKVSVGIEASANYENAFQLVVYVSGVEQERFECTKELFIDGFGNQMFVEEVINGVSRYIEVVNNPANTDLPLPSDYSVWIQNPEDIFQAVAGVSVDEDVLAGHTEIYVASVGDITMGDRIKIFDQANEVLGEEYKVVSVTGNSIMIDRKATQNVYKIDSPVIYRFASSLTDPTEGIENGVKRYAPVKLDKPYPGYKIGRPMAIGDLQGTVADAGANFTVGGSDGSPVTVGDMITAVKVLDNKGNTPVNIFDDGGLADPAYAQALLAAAKKQRDCHAMLSSPANLEDYPDAPQRIVDYRQSVGIDDRYASLFSGWIRVFDDVNQVYVWEAPSIYGTCAQSFVTRERTIFTPAAGLVNGIIAGLGVRYKFEEGERDLLVANQINPIKYDNGTIAIWGNETLQKRPSPLQLRSVNFLLISLQIQVESLNEYRLFDFNDETTWTALEGAIDALLRDDYQAKRGVYEYVVAIQDVITDTDINQRKMPIFIGLQPTLDIQTIPTTIAIYSKGAEIEVRV